MKAIDIFDKLLARVQWWYARHSPTKLRYGEVESKPGEFIVNLEPEEREILGQLTSEELSDNELMGTKNVYYMVGNENFHNDKYSDSLFRKAKLKFDQDIKQSKK